MSKSKFNINAENVGQVGDKNRAGKIVQKSRGERAARPAESQRASAPAPVKNNPWTAGSFYLVTAVIIMAALGALAKFIPWYALPFIILGGVLVLSIVVASQLRNDERLSDKSFTTLMVESLKYLPLIKNLFPKGPTNPGTE
jgi:Flp pilus assembly protein TadB